MNKIITGLLIAIIAVFGADGGCSKKYDVPVGSDQGDSAGDNQPAQKCQPQPIKIQPVNAEAPEVYEYSIFVDIEDEDCGTMQFKNKMAVERDGAYQVDGIAKHMVWDDGKSGKVNVSPPYHTRGIIEKSIPHNIGVIAVIVVTTEMVQAGAAWLVCRIERGNMLAPPRLGNVPLARVAITGPGRHEVHCRVLT